MGSATVTYAAGGNAEQQRIGSIHVTGTRVLSTSVTQAGAPAVPPPPPLNASFTVSRDPCPIEGIEPGLHVIGCAFDAGGSTGASITSYEWTIGIFNFAGPMLVGVRIGCGFGEFGTAEIPVTLTIRNAGGSHSVTRPVVFRKDVGC
jgi:hypothetical protein